MFLDKTLVTNPKLSLEKADLLYRQGEYTKTLAHFKQVRLLRTRLID